MRLYRPTYPEDCSQQPGAYPGGDAPYVWKTGTFSADIVHSTIDAEGTPEAEVDVATRARQAGATRSACNGSKLKSYYETLTRKFARGGQAEMKNYQAASQSLADLEERIWFYPDVSSAAMRRLSSHG
jgi:hypothetical protein